MDQHEELEAEPEIFGWGPRRNKTKNAGAEFEKGKLRFDREEVVQRKLEVILMNNHLELSVLMKIQKQANFVSILLC